MKNYYDDPIFFEKGSFFLWRRAGHGVLICVLLFHPLPSLFPVHTRGHARVSALYTRSGRPSSSLHMAQCCQPHFT